jgi:hypothetical protein
MSTRSPVISVLTVFHTSLSFLFCFHQTVHFWSCFHFKECLNFKVNPVLYCQGTLTVLESGSLLPVISVRASSLITYILSYFSILSFILLMGFLVSALALRRFLPRTTPQSLSLRRSSLRTLPMATGFHYPGDSF